MDYDINIIMEEFIMEEITGMLAIGNGEKCPYCKIVKEKLNSENIELFINYLVSWRFCIVVLNLFK